MPEIKENAPSKSLLPVDFHAKRRGMKLFLFSIMMSLVTGVSAWAEASPIRMDVQQRQKTDSKGKSHESKTQMRSLEISLQNLSRLNCDNLVVKYWFFAKGIKDGDTDIFKHGERKTSVAAGKKEVVESESVSSSYTEDHVEVEKGKSKGGKNATPKVKKVEGSGDRIVGYGVRVMDGEKVLAEVFSPQGLKEKVK